MSFKDGVTGDKHDDEVDASTACFADDSTVLLAAPDDITMQRTMNETSKIFGDYFSCQGMKVNQTQEEHICFYPRGMQRNLQDGVEVGGRKEATSMKLLGVTVSQGYQFTNHLSKTISKVSQRLSHVKRLGRYLTEDRMKQVVDSMVMSVLRFGLEFCGRDHTNLVRLQKTLNNVLRVVTRSGWRTSVRWMLSHTKFLNMRLQMSYQRMTLVRRALMTGACPLTISMVKYTGVRSRTGHYRSLMPKGPKN